MRFCLSAAIVLSAAVWGGAALAEDTPPPPQTPAPAQEVKIVPPEKKVCKSITRVGSRTDTRRVCLTKAEWAEVQAKHREGFDELMRLHDNPNGAGNQ